MHRAFFCIECGNPIATMDGGEIKIQHRGRIIRVHGSVSIICEKCGKENRVEQKDLRGLCSDHTAVPSGPAGDAASV